VVGDALQVARRQQQVQRALDLARRALHRRQQLAEEPPVERIPAPLATAGA
jgi:hypothetical protein